MNTATVSVFIDKYHPRKIDDQTQKNGKHSGKEGECAVSIRITFDRKKKYYPTGISLKAKDFERIMTAKRRNEADNTIYKKIRSFEDKANKAIEKLPDFTPDKFENIYLCNRDAPENISTGFKAYIKELEEENRIATAIGYECALNSLEAFKKGLRYADITPALLRKYQKWMLENGVVPPKGKQYNKKGEGRSLTTIGIYLRNLRSIMNMAAIDKSIYPFGNGKNKYQIPTSRNIKKALTLQEIAGIFNYNAPEHSTEEMAKDYWFFIYLCNGLNVKDLCFLKRKDIDGNTIKFERAKTSHTKKEAEKIIISLKPEARKIIDKWGQPSISPDSYIFPHLKPGMTAVEERKVYKQLTKTINKYMKRIASNLGINKDVTTYFARHSFATILRNSGASIEFISAALGHSSKDTTKRYLDSFEEKVIHETTDALTAFGN